MQGGSGEFILGFRKSDFLAWAVDGFCVSFPRRYSSVQAIMTFVEVTLCCLGGFFVGYVAGATQRIVRRAFEILD